MRLWPWLPLAFGRRNELTLAEQRKAFGTGAVTPPKRTQQADSEKLALPRMCVVRKQA